MPRRRATEIHPLTKTASDEVPAAVAEPSRAEKRPEEEQAVHDDVRHRIPQGPEGNSPLLFCRSWVAAHQKLAEKVFSGVLALAEEEYMGNERQETSSNCPRRTTPCNILI